MSLDTLLAPHRRWMKQALREAEKAYEIGEVPVGAVVVHGDVSKPFEARVVGRGHNRVEQLADPTAHAEVLAVTAACEALGTKYLAGCTLYVTLEPCPMCAGALMLARLDRLVFGAFDEKAGCASTLYNLVQDARFNHQMEVLTGLDADQSAAMLRAFFAERRR